ncbi:MAG: hypothetical protein RBU45_09320 [Myxococcota bacterium]|jgi:hypothetical protein|nr:hypothetical protein [Myxococcota bacterium]
MSLLETWRRGFFCRPARRLRWLRPVGVGLRTLHIVTMGLLLGGTAAATPDAQLRLALLLTAASGLGLLLLELAKSGVVIYQGSGVAIWLKLGVLGLVHLLPDHRLLLLILATVVASIGSHMSANWRHYSLLDRRVLTSGPPSPGGPDQPVSRSAAAGSGSPGATP